MKLSTPQGHLEIPQDFEFEIKASHPFFSREGSASVPVTIPATPSNLAILGYPERADRTKRFIRESSAIAECGVWRKQCKILTESAGLSAGIALCLALNESEMYSQIRSRKLKDIFSAYTHTPVSGVKPIDAFRALHLEGINGKEFPFALFPVAASLGEKENIIMINEEDAPCFIRTSARTITVGEETISFPSGYAVAPYIFLWAMIEYAFTSVGFRVSSNCFKDDDELCKIVVLHNNADVSVNMCEEDGSGWGFHYRDLVPDITLDDLVVWIRDKFGATIRNDSGDISIYLIRDLLTSAPDYDLTPLMMNEETLSYPSPSILERSVDTSIDSASPAAESLEHLREMYSNCSDVTLKEDIAGSGLFYVSSLGKYYYKTADGDAVLLGSAAFPYKRRTECSAESISTDDCFVPSIIHDGAIVPYIGMCNHLYLENGIEKQRQPLMVCYAFDIDADWADIYTTHGSSFPYDRDGGFVRKGFQPLAVRPGIGIIPSYPPLTPEGLAPFWSGYQKILMNGTPEISLECRFPMADLMTINLVTPKLFKGAHVLIKDITYKVTASATTTARLTLQLIPTYSDMVLPATVTFSQNLVWKLMSTRTIFDDDYHRVTETDGLTDYVDSDAPSTTPRRVGQTTMNRERWLIYLRKDKNGFILIDPITYTWEEYFVAQAQE